MTRLAPLFLAPLFLAACSLADSGWVVPPPVDDDDSVVADDDDSSAGDDDSAVSDDDDSSVPADDDDSSAGDDDSAVSDDDDSTPPGAVDADNDGYTPVVDCDDANANVNPGAAEADNGIDDNCNGQIDEGFDPDQDGDGYSPEPDCDDEDPAVYPGATEVCNGIDDNCNGSVDEGLDCSVEPSLFVSVAYPQVHDLITLSIQPIWTQDELGDWWWAAATEFNSNSTDINVAGEELEGLLGLRLNVTVADDLDSDGDFDIYQWLCEGHWATAQINSAVEVEVSYANFNSIGDWDEDDLLPWSPAPASNVSLGCSALLWWADPVPTEGYVGP